MSLNPCARWIAIKKGRLFWNSNKGQWAKSIHDAKCFDDAWSAYRSVAFEDAPHVRLVSIEVVGRCHITRVQVPYRKSNKLGYIG